MLVPFSGFAAGLGKLSVISNLGEPFKAQIEVLSVGADEIDTLVATIASEETYIAQGISRPDIQSSIEIELAQNSDGRPILKLHSSQPVNDSFLDMLIQLDWASGRLLREYTILLDPPGLKAAPDDASVLPNELPSVEVSVHPVANGFDTSVVEVEPFITKSGDTLNDIAKQLQVDGVGLDQMLVGLFDNNKQAFKQGNMNRLKIGKIIKVPSYEKLVAIDELEAKKLVEVHVANWKVYRGSLAKTVLLAPTSLDADQKQNVAGKITGAEDQAVSSKTGTQNIVKLSAGVKDAANPSKEMEAKLTMLQEENTAQAKSLKEAQERTANLEKQIADMRKLLALNSQIMADLQKNTAINIAKPVAQFNTLLPPSRDGQVASTSTIPETSLIKTTDQAKQKEPDSDLIQIIFGVVNSSIFIAATGITLLLGFLWLIRNKPKKVLEKFEVKALNQVNLDDVVPFGNTTNRNHETDTVFLQDVAQSSGGTLMDTSGVESIDKAELDIAYGSYEQEEAKLKSVISRTPKVKASAVTQVATQKVSNSSKDVVMPDVSHSEGHPDLSDISNAMEAINLDFELDSPKKSSTKPSPTLSEVLQDQGIQRNAKGFDFSSITFDLNEADTKPAVPIPNDTQIVSPIDDLQALDLKLDLVLAYIDMGDSEGARILLEEVKNVGNKQQKLRAKKLLAKLV